MFSVIVYGRNDTHGYNLHKRAAISFNAIAEVMSDPDDEILFVDYNTPDDHPTFPEAIHDTLTDKAKKAHAHLPRAARAPRAAEEQDAPRRARGAVAQRGAPALQSAQPLDPLHQHRHAAGAARREAVAERHPGRAARRLLPDAALRDSGDAVGGRLRPPRSGRQPRQAARLVAALPPEPGRAQPDADEVRRAGRLPGGAARGHVRHPRLRRGR